MCSCFLNFRRSCWPPIIVRPTILVLSHVVKSLQIIWRLATPRHHNDVIMSVTASQITSVSIVCSTVGSGTDQRKYKSSASLAFAQGIHRWPVNSLHKGPVTQKMFTFDDVIMWYQHKRIRLVITRVTCHTIISRQQTLYSDWNYMTPFIQSYHSHTCEVTSVQRIHDEDAYLDSVIVVCDTNTMWCLWYILPSE